MRKVLPVIVFIFATITVCSIAACGGGDKKEGAKTDKAPGAENSLADNPDYTAGLELVSKNDCLTCHRTAGKLTGPAYEEVAAKYAGADDKKIEELANTIIKGVAADKGIWGTNQAMTPHPAISVDDAKKMVKYILLLKK